MRLAMSKAGIPTPEIGHVRRMGGMLPQQKDIVQAAQAFMGAR